MLRAVLGAVIVSIITSTFAWAAEPKTWEYSRGGDWQASAPNAAPGTTQPAVVPALDRVEQLLKENKNREAEKSAIRWVLANRKHSQQDRGLFLIAQALYQYGNRIRAYYYLDELMDEYPESRYYPAALEKQYEIADGFLKGYKRRFLYIPMFRGYDEGIEMLFRIQNRSPGSPLAERALLRTANFYYHDEQYDFAADTYAAYLRSYPRSPITPRVRLRQAYSLYAQFRGPMFDATPAIDAREQLRELIAQYPDLAKQENLPQLVSDIDRTLAHKLFETADFYRRTKQPAGAAYTYRYVVKAYPGTEEAQASELALRSLPPSALNGLPDPAIMPAYAPGTPQTGPRMLPANNKEAPTAAPSGIFDKEAGQPSDRPTFR
jgi:outer membrane protein assembly factor BamD (BamD/ComL family)